MRTNMPVEWLLSFGNSDEPAGYISVGDREVLNQRRAQSETQAATARTSATAEEAMAEVLHPNATALLSQAVLAEDWERPEEDAAWSHLQSAR